MLELTSGYRSQSPALGVCSVGGGKREPKLSTHATLQRTGRKSGWHHNTIVQSELMLYPWDWLHVHCLRAAVHAARGAPSRITRRHLGVRGATRCAHCRVKSRPQGVSSLTHIDWCVERCCLVPGASSGLGLSAPRSGRALVKHRSSPECCKKAQGTGIKPSKGATRLPWRQLR